MKTIWKNKFFVLTIFGALFFTEKNINIVFVSFVCRTLGVTVVVELISVALRYFNTTRNTFLNLPANEVRNSCSSLLNLFSQKEQVQSQDQETKTLWVQYIKDIYNNNPWTSWSLTSIELISSELYAYKMIKENKKNNFINKRKIY